MAAPDAVEVPRLGEVGHGRPTWALWLGDGVRKAMRPAQSKNLATKTWRGPVLWRHRSTTAGKGWQRQRVASSTGLSKRSSERRGEEGRRGGEEQGCQQRELPFLPTAEGESEERRVV